MSTEGNDYEEYKALDLDGPSGFLVMVILVVEFSSRGKKLEISLPKNQHTQRKLLNFENWVNREVSKIGDHFKK